MLELIVASMDVHGNNNNQNMYQICIKSLYLIFVQVLNSFKMFIAKIVHISKYLNS